MKKIIAVLLLIAGVQSFAQPLIRDKSHIAELKIGFLSKELSLSTEEAQKFWPVYNAYTEELKNARKENRQDVILFDERSLAIKKKYLIEFKTILGTQERANRVFSAEKEFGTYIRQEFEKRQKMRLSAPPSNN